MIDFGTSQSPKSTRPLTTYWCPSRPGHQALRNNFASSLLLRTWLPYDWTPRSEAYFVFPLAQGTPGKQCGLAATGDYQPSLRSPWLAASERSLNVDHKTILSINAILLTHLQQDSVCKAGSGNSGQVADQNTPQSSAEIQIICVRGCTIGGS
ncbi:hypothetical protein [Thiolapillus sp.]|uniref:hypothetical protein n=3 Tax=Thiolapillus sp. TaxID=2017437 RepID=UPI003AF97A53